MADNATDENTKVEDSSTSTEGTTSTDVSSKTSTSTVESGDKTETLGDAISAAFKESTKEDSPPSSDKADESDVLKKNETPEEEKAEESTEGSPDKDRKPSFQDHPDWQKMVKERDTYRQENEALKPVAEAHEAFAKHWQEHGITPDQVREIVNFGTLLFTDPMKFKEEFSETWKQITGLTGDTLPPDLQSQLDGIDEELEAGTISKVRADQLRQNVKEVAKLRGQQAINKTRGELTRKQQEQQRSQQFHQQITTTLRSWVDSKKKTDLEFAPKTNGVEGKYELFLDMVKAMALESPIKTPNDVITLAEKAYNRVNSFASRGTKPASGKVLNSTRSSVATTTSQPKTLKEAIAQAAASHGIK